MVYNRKNLIARTANALGQSQVMVGMVVDALLEEVKIMMKEGTGTCLEIRGFGTFTVAIRKGRAYKAPETNRVVVAPDHPTVKFKPSKHILGA